MDNPGLNDATDARVNSDDTDPHSALYVSQRIDLQQPATSLRVILTAARPADADFRVLYKLVRADSSEIDQTYELFPGYETLIDTDNDGFGDEVINIAANTGHPDSIVPPSLTPNDYLEYQFTADNLEQFTGYVINIVSTTTNQSKVPTFRDIRTIALA